MAERDWREEHCKLELKLSEVSNLVAALQVVAWQLRQTSLEPRTELSELRNAVIGIGDGLEKLVRPA
ncbi:hypothetical protein [uncultured Roseovarius sp.]|uniref:hypothetical protein n=1 Tax=uncultured Roseovarius sp. TaxID=293344 RepID=UPI002595AEA5|nr:hypothetical protein [uncultured Roseovarius sp.]